MSRFSKLSWEKLTDDELLDLRFCDFNLKIKDSRIEPLVEQLHDELAEKGLRFNVAWCRGGQGNTNTPSTSC